MALRITAFEFTLTLAAARWNMQLLNTISDFRRARAEVTGTLGLVPTMGYLHEGHLALVRRARAENDAVAVSIFVNPTQFGPNEDLQDYPRDLQRDLALLKEEKVALLFNPSPEEMYPEGHTSLIDVGPVSEPLEGMHRPGHFRGVATVVAKLFNIVRPDRAYFGQKDGQQVQVIKRMAVDLDFPVEVVVAPTVREPEGLAMSSRNIYLNEQERRAALCLSQSLLRAQERWAAGERSAKALRRLATEAIEKEPLARIDYVSLADAEALEELSGPIDRPAMLSLAVRIGKTRLIDNIILGDTLSL